MATAGIVGQKLREVVNVFVQDDSGFAEFVDAEKESLLAEVDILLEQGLLSAPAFVLDDQIFHGREHLPLIGWMLAGSQGTPPV